MRLAFVLVLAACGSTQADPEYPPQLPLPEEYRQCEIDDDCTVIELGVCDHCNGGMVAAVSKDRADDAYDRFGDHEPLGKNEGCTLMGCAPVDSICEADLCIERELGMNGTVPGTY